MKNLKYCRKEYIVTKNFYISNCGFGIANLKFENASNFSNTKDIRMTIFYQNKN